MGHISSNSNMCQCSNSPSIILIAKDKILMNCGSRETFLTVMLRSSQYWKLKLVFFHCCLCCSNLRSTKTDDFIKVFPVVYGLQGPCNFLLSSESSPEKKYSYRIAFNKICDFLSFFFFWLILFGFILVTFCQCIMRNAFGVGLENCNCCGNLGWLFRFKICPEINCRG